MALHNFPVHTTSFLGRNAEIAAFADLLRDSPCRLLTLFGLGGVGKTRLAVAVAAQLRDTFPDGIYFVPLQPLQSTEQILHTTISVLQLPTADNPRTDLLAYLRERHLLLLFDNFEHLLDGVDLLADILEAAPQVKILATSRQTLNLQDEWQRQVQGLPYLETNHHEDGAAALFIDRAQRLHGDLDFTTQAEAIDQICRLVEGMPLALELSAGWVKVLSCAQIADEIQSGLNILAARAQDALERHRSMQAVFDHSWSLLTAQEQSVLRRFAVFRGGATREAAEAVTGANLDDLAALVDKSLLRHDPATGRYDMQELLRQYAAEQLAAAGETAAIADRHTAYFADFVARLTPMLNNDLTRATLDTVEADFDNIWAAWTQAANQRAYDQIDSMIDGLYVVVDLRTSLLGGSKLFAEAAKLLEPLPGESPHPVYYRVRLRMLPWAGVDVVTLNEILTFTESHGMELETAQCLRRRGSYFLERGEFEAALSDYQRNFAIVSRFQEPKATTRALSLLAEVCMYMGNLEEGKTYIDQGYALAHKYGLSLAAHDFLMTGAWILMHEGDVQRGEKKIRQALQIAVEMESPWRVLADRLALNTSIFFRGDITSVRKSTRQLVHKASIQGIPALHANSLLGLSRIALFDEDFHRAKELAQEALSRLPQSQQDQANYLRRIALCDCGLGNFEQARSHMRKALPYTYPSIWAKLGEFSSCAFILAHEGESRRATELLGLMFTHPASAKGWLEKWPPMRRLRDDLETTLGTEAYCAAWEAGARSDPAEVFATMLREFCDADDAATAAANQSLPNPLTGRELEILALLAESLSNPQIAERLFISVPTVKTHVQHILDKLDASDRRHATERARDLGLLYHT